MLPLLGFSEKEGFPSCGKAAAGALPSCRHSLGPAACPSSDVSPLGGLAASSIEGARDMAEQLSEEQVAEFMEAFHRFDKDKDSAINTQELGLNPSEATLKGFIARDDADGDGVISSQEFLAVIAKGVQARARADDLRTAFHAFDLDGDGHISMDELKQAMAQLEVSQEELDIMIREADMDRDGQVSYEEFVHVLMLK